MSLIQEKKLLKESCITECHHIMGDRPQKLENFGRLNNYRQLSMLENVLSRFLSMYPSGSLFVLCCSTGLCFFQPTWWDFALSSCVDLILKECKQLCLSKSLFLNLTCLWVIFSCLYCLSTLENVGGLKQY